MPGPYPPSADVPKECIFTTFYTSSGYLRREIFIEAAEKMDRIPVLLGNSMERYYGTALKMGYVKKPDNLRIFGYRRSIDKAMKQMLKDGKQKFLPIVTGHQGEQDAVLGRIASGELDFKLSSGDKVLFSKYSGTEVKIDGDEHLIMREEDLLAILD